MKMMTMKLNFKTSSPVDLHMHSKFSIDGECSCEQLLRLASDKKIKIMSLTDHNCMKGIDELITLSHKFNIHVIPAIEFDSIYQGRETHILGYGIDYQRVMFQHLDEEINALEFQAFGQKIDRLCSLYDISMDKETLLIRCQTENPFEVIYGTFLMHPDCRKHPDLLPYLPNGSRSDNAIVNFYWDICAYGHEAYVPLAYPDTKDVIQQIHDSGGIAILAHPGINFFQREDMLDELCSYGIDGIEVFSSYHREQENAYFKEYCLAKNLLISGGSDFHGTYKPNIEMGEFGIHEDELYVLEPLLEILKKRECIS